MLAHDLGPSCSSCNSRASQQHRPAVFSSTSSRCDSIRRSVIRRLGIWPAEAYPSGGEYSALGEDDYPSEMPTRYELMQRPDKQKPTVRVRLSVHYRVHSRQILCIGGSQIPLGWSFLSIAKVPMTWNSGDIWTCEVRFLLLRAKTPFMMTQLRVKQVELQAGQRIEHKYVILEEQVRGRTYYFCIIFSIMRLLSVLGLEQDGREGCTNRGLGPRAR